MRVLLYRIPDIWLGFFDIVTFLDVHVIKTILTLHGKKVFRNPLFSPQAILIYCIVMKNALTLKIKCKTGILQTSAHFLLAPLHKA